MAKKAGDACPQCKNTKKGMLIYSGRDKSGPANSYQRILQCNSCKWECTEDQVRKK